MINAKQRDGIADKVVAFGVGGRAGGARRSVPTVPGSSTRRRCYRRPARSAAATEEVFGPVAPIITVTDDEDAVAMANRPNGADRLRLPGISLAGCASASGSRSGWSG